MNRISDKQVKKQKSTKIKKRVIIGIILIAVILFAIYFINKALPIKDVTDENINIELSTSKLTGSNVEATISTSTKYNIFYYIDYVDEETENLDESDYYAEALSSEETKNSVSNSTNSTNADNTSNTSNSTNTVSTIESSPIKNIEDKSYQKLTSNTLSIENNGTVYLKYERFGKLSKTPYTFEISNIDKTGPEIGEIETSSTDSTITVTVTAADLGSSNLTYYFKLQEDDDFKCTNSKNTYMFTDLTEDESYTIFIKVADEFGNESKAVTDAVASSKVTTTEKKLYYIRVNIAANTVTIYDIDEDGKYTEPIKAMVCSTGTATPTSGVYQISDRYRWRSLFGGVYGQYAVRIHGNILFHSVPYTDMYPDTLEYEEYDKLGTTASAGCIRLTVKDEKWIYDNVASGSYVEFYSDKNNPGPLGKPTAQKISDNKTNRNWDPTDPDTRNPWLGGTGIVTKVKNQILSATNTTTNVINTTNTTNTNISNTTNTTNSVSNNTTNTTNTNTVLITKDPADDDGD